MFQRQKFNLRSPEIVLRIARNTSQWFSAVMQFLDIPRIIIASESFLAWKMLAFTQPEFLFKTSMLLFWRIFYIIHFAISTIEI